MVTKIDDGEDPKMMRGTPMGNSRMQAMPPMNAARPPSTSSVPGGPGAPRTTVTSRRGGRTRARSPAVIAGQRQPGDSTPQPPAAGVGENPSSAAAAAAATAAKVGAGPWPDRRMEDVKYLGGGGAAPPPPGYGPSKWPHQEGAYRSRRYGPYDGYPPHVRGPQQRGPEENPAYADRRYREYRGGPRPYPPGAPHAGYYPNDYRFGQGREYRGSSTPKGQRPSGGRNMVLGGSTPIHVPKTPGGSTDPAASGRSSRGGSAASVFRGRPEDREMSANDDESSPQKILLSLRTPTMSFDDSGADKEKKNAPNSGQSLSPDGPPNIQNSSQQRPDQEANTGEETKAGIDMASSFNLFNQSFDSFGGDYFNVDPSLQNDSFGIGRAGSAENDAGNTQLLQGSSSGGNFAAQILGPTGSTNLSMGYSPVNSFGNPSAGIASAGPSHRGNMMVLGGGNQRSASPSQVLGMYRSYSGSGVRMDTGSFGGPPRGPPGPYYYGIPPRPAEGDRGPSFYSFLILHKGAFVDCTFLLPGLKAALAGQANSEQTPFQGYGEPSPEDNAIARRRVESSVCAFGGNIKRETPRHSTKDSFPKGGEQLATVTPSSSVASPPRSSDSEARKARKKYEDDLPGRYYENESRLSWEFEESPPVVVPISETDKEDDSNSSDSKSDSASKDTTGPGDDDLFCSPTGQGSPPGSKKKSLSPNSKMKYRCKLCGQPKQNHVCPYQQSLARSIGVNVYPTVNAFAAAEPGTIAPALTEMNNFVDAQKEGSSVDSSPSRPSPSSATSVPSTNQVTPDSLRSGPRQSQSPTDAQSPGLDGRTPVRGNGASRRGGSKKRSRPRTDYGGDALFAEPMELNSEQFRTITPFESSGQPLFDYPGLPLPYAQRKKLSDNLFTLSNDVPKLTDECAQVLREAREKDMWDLAVAELMTQVVVVIHCAEGDNRFEGLRQYLLTLGIAS